MAEKPSMLSLSQQAAHTPPSCPPHPGESSRSVFIPTLNAPQGAKEEKLFTCYKCHHLHHPSPSNCLGTHWSLWTVLCSGQTHLQNTDCKATWKQRKEHIREEEVLAQGQPACLPEKGLLLSFTQPTHSQHPLQGTFLPQEAAMCCGTLDSAEGEGTSGLSPKYISEVF